MGVIQLLEVPEVFGLLLDEPLEAGGRLLAGRVHTVDALGFLGSLLVLRRLGHFSGRFVASANRCARCSGHGELSQHCLEVLPHLGLAGCLRAAVGAVASDLAALGVALGAAPRALATRVSRTFAAAVLAPLLAAALAACGCRKAAGALGRGNRSAVAASRLAPALGAGPVDRAGRDGVLPELVRNRLPACFVDDLT